MVPEHGRNHCSFLLPVVGMSSYPCDLDVGRVWVTLGTGYYDYRVHSGMTESSFAHRKTPGAPLSTLGRHGHSLTHLLQDAVLCLDKGRKLRRDAGLRYEGQYELNANPSQKTASHFGQYVFLEASLLDDMWADCRCGNPHCDRVKLQAMGVVKEGSALTGHFRCPECNTAWTRSTDFRLRHQGSTPFEINLLQRIIAIQAGLSPTSERRANDFLGVMQPAASTNSTTQAKNLGMFEKLGKDACGDMFEQALKDCVADPSARKNKDGLWILDVMVPLLTIQIYLLIPNLHLPL